MTTGNACLIHSFVSASNNIRYFVHSVINFEKFFSAQSVTSKLKSVLKQQKHTLVIKYFTLMFPFNKVSGAVESTAVSSDTKKWIFP